MATTLKRAGVLLAAAFAMVLALLPATAFAAPPSVTVNVGGMGNGDTATALQLVSYDDTYNNYQVLDSFAAYMTSKDATLTTDAARMEYLSKLEPTALATYLDGYRQTLESGTWPKPAAQGTATEIGVATLSNLAPGFYYILGQGSNGITYNPTTVFVKADGDSSLVYAGAASASDAQALSPNADGTTYTINFKAQGAPTVAKQVSDDAKNWGSAAAAGVGDTTYYLVKVNVPLGDTINYTTFKLNDTLSNMQYKAGSVKVYADQALSTEIEGAATSATAGEYDTTKNTQSLEIALDYSKIKDGQTGDTRGVYVYYEATVAGHAATDKKASNSIEATYQNGTTASSHTVTGNTVSAFNYAFELSKSKGNNQPLAGAKFSIYKTADDAAAALQFVKTSGNEGTATYRLALSGETSTVSELEAPFKIEGLDAATYYVAETTTPEGYSAPSAKFNAVLVAGSNEGGVLTGDLDKQGSKFTSNADTDNALIERQEAQGSTLSTTLLNTALASLPTTGGMGTIAFTVVGVALMALAVGLLFFRRSRGRKESRR